MHVRPALVHALPVVILNQTERCMMELDERSAIFLAQPVLQIGDNRIRHEQRTGKFNQRGPLDGLHVSPEMPVAISQIAIPPASS